MAEIDEWRGEPCWAKVGNAGQRGRKAWAEAKLLCSLHLQNALALPGAFLDSTDSYTSIFSPSHGLHLEVDPAGAPGPRAPSGSAPATSDCTKQALPIPHRWHKTSPSPSPFPVFLQLKNPT